jgi:hypothetical protein
VIDQPPSCNGENPTEEVSLRAFEPIQTGCDVEPYFGSEIFAVLRLLRQEIAENPRLEGTVEVGQRALVAAPCGRECGSEVPAEEHPPPL